MIERLEDRGASTPPAGNDVVGPRPQGVQAACSGRVPGARIGTGRVDSNLGGLPPEAQCLELPDGVEDGPIEDGQGLGEGLGLHSVRVAHAAPF